MPVPASTRLRIALAYAAVGTLTLGAWAVALVAARTHPILLPAALLAFGLGLRHAVDADHIAVIDNTTRKLMADGGKPVAVGLFFSLGHSSIVVALTGLVALTSSAILDRPDIREAGSLIATLVSATFLIAIGVINLLLLRGIWAAFRRVARGDPLDEAGFDALLDGRGIVARVLRPVVRAIRSSPQAFIVGFLFGLGFETASEVALLGLAAGPGIADLPPGVVLVLPALFAAGMTLVDTTDGVLMLGAYGWAYIKPLRKLYYNLTITAASAAVALVIGGIELASIVADRAGLSGPPWDAISELDFGSLGLAVLVLLALSWVLAALIYRAKGYDAIGETTR
jgi:high-affinity nickel-transport protein